MAHCKAVLEIEGPKAEALAKALEPDNLQAPEDVRVECRAEGDVLVCRVSVECSDARGILRLRNTLNDLILNLRAAASALEAGLSSKSTQSTPPADREE